MDFRYPPVLSIVAGQKYAPRHPDVALHAGMALVARSGRVLTLAAHVSGAGVCRYGESLYRLL